MKKRIAYLPLDERPVNTRFPAMIADIAEAALVLPPDDLLSHFRTPADPDRLLVWLRATTPDCDALIVSLEMLGSGGLIASRTSTEAATLIATRLHALADLKQQHPDLVIYAFTVITRIPNYDDATEEPAYWADFGSALHRLSRLYDRRGRGESVGGEIAEIETAIPPSIRRDWLTRRLRNHTLNLAALDLLAREVFDLLVISSDDTTPEGLGTREKAWIASWGGLVPGDDSRLLMYPGADEIGCVLLARLLLESRIPSFRVDYAIENDKDRIAPFEDGAVSLTVERQIRAVGGEITSDEAADFVVMVNPPSPLGREFDPAFARQERADRTPALALFVDRLVANLAAGRRVIVADVAYPNGADPVLIDLLLEHVDLSQLAAYGAWNTAGNTIGTALAQGVASSFARTQAQIDAQERFLTHRLLEDWGYQHLVRQQVREWMEAHDDMRKMTAQNMHVARQRVADALADCLARLPHLRDRWHLAVGSVRFPWQRTFEVDFDLFADASADIVIVGGGLGGIAAALAALRDPDVTVALFEATPMIGGQVTSQGVSALDEHEHIEHFGATATYQYFRQAVRDYYLNSFGASGDEVPLNPGNGWVSRLCFDPRVGRDVLEAMLRAGGNRLHVYTCHTVTSAAMDGDSISKLTVRDDRSGLSCTVVADVFIDATELGDLLPLTSTSYVTGAEARAETGEPSAPDRAAPGEIQGFTMCFAVEFCPGENHTIAKPDGYEGLRDSQPFTLCPRDRDGQPMVYRFFETSPQGRLPFWTYRRIHDGALLGGHDVALINWVSNDYHGRSIIDVSPEERAAAIEEAKRLSMGFLYWLQTECPRDDGGIGYPELKLRPDIMSTDDGLAAFPYVREARRIIPLKRVGEQDIGAEFNTDARARNFSDSVGVGWYAMDLHACVGNPSVSMYAPTKPFQVPLGALIPQATRNLIAACKNIGTTHVTSGAYRLHPVEWGIGEAAGALAVSCVRENAAPAEIQSDPRLLWALQSRLIGGGAPIFWVMEQSDAGDDYRPNVGQLLLVRGILQSQCEHRRQLWIDRNAESGFDLDAVRAIGEQVNRWCGADRRIDLARMRTGITWGEIVDLFATIELQNAADGAL